MRNLGKILLGLLAGYLVVRGVVELCTVDYGDPSSYRADWGGPSLAGVLIVHVGPAVLVLGWLGRAVVRVRSAKLVRR